MQMPLEGGEAVINIHSGMMRGLDTTRWWLGRRRGGWPGRRDRQEKQELQGRDGETVVQEAP